MRAEHLIVLKLGGSVLLDETTLRQAVHEIYRWRRRGWGVVAVASALAGRTDRLLAESRGICDSPAPDAVAPLVSQGELHSTALLGLHLDRAGLPPSASSPRATRWTPLRSGCRTRASAAPSSGARWSSCRATWPAIPRGAACSWAAAAPT